MGSKKVKNDLQEGPADVAGYRSQLSNYLSGIISGGGINNKAYQTQNPMQDQIMQGYSDLLSSGGSGAYGASQRYMQNLIEGGNPIDSSAYVNQAKNSWERDIAPGVKSQMGGFGMRYSGAAIDSLSRAGRDVNYDLNAKLLGLEQWDRGLRSDASKSMLSTQLAGLQGATGFGEAARGGQQMDRSILAQLLMGGAGAVGTNKWNYVPQQFQQSGWGQGLGAAAGLAGTIFGGPMGGMAASAIMNGYLGKQQGQG